MKYIIEVNRNDCNGCGVCYNTDPSHYEADWENKSAVVNGKGKEISRGSFDDSLLEDAKMAATACSVYAITIIETG